MSTRLIIDGNAVYEIDEECLECRERERGQKDVCKGRNGQRQEIRGGQKKK